MKVLLHKLKKISDAWEIRVFILVSLYMQTFLILFSPFRKRTTSKWIMILVWSAYMLADWVAAFSIGLISDSLGESPKVAEVEDLMVFWAPFLLLHLGGPDTITAFALEDNELWLRHFLGLIVQVAASAYVFLQSLPNKLWPATLLMFLAGIIKYAERTRALYLASFNSFRGSMLKEPDPGPNYAKLMEEYSSRKKANLPIRIQKTPELREETMLDCCGHNEIPIPLNEFEVVQNAYHFFDKFKGLIVDLIFSFHERNESREFFRKRTAKDAFAVIEVELNFIYEVLYTKIVVIHCKMGYFFRIVSFSSVFLALILFLLLDKSKFHKSDVRITYTLLCGAIVLDIISFIMLLFADWTILARKKPPKELIFATIFEKFLTIRRHWFSDQYIKFPSIIFGPGFPKIKCCKIPLRILCRRWSESISQYNLLSHCLNERQKKVDEVYNYLGVKEFLDEQAHVSTRKFTDKLREFIFDELRTKSVVASDSEAAKDMCSSRGDWVLRDNNCNDLLPWTIHREFDESLLLWHIATEICYNTEEGNECQNDDRDFAKLLSNYMMYLLVMQPTMMLAVAGIGQIRYRDTCAEAKRIFHKWNLVPGGKSKEACMRLLRINTDIPPVVVKGDRSKSVLFDGCILAKELNLKGDKWEIMSKVWVELLSFAASHCRANAHAQQVSKGGELISLVWLLMVHLGLGDQFRINEGHARAKLIVGK